MTDLQGCDDTLSSRDETQYWVHENETRRDFKKTTMTKYMTGPTDYYLTELHMHFEMFYNSLHT